MTTVTSAPASGSTRRRPRARGWVPDQHGAWAMVSLPLVAGVGLSGPVPVHLALAATWLLGYFTFYAAGKWVRSRRSRERTPTLVYAAACGPFAATTALAAPHLLRWVPVFLPLLVASLWLTARGRERSLANDAITVVAAGLMTPVAADAGGLALGPQVWVATGALTAYFLGTVPYVKTMIRERGRTVYVRGSVAYHLLGTVGAALLTAGGWQSWLLPAVWLLLTARAWAGPAANRRRARPLRPAVIGAGEIVASLAVTVTVLFGLPAGP